MKRIVTNVSLLFVGLVIAASVAEFALRVLNLPGITFHTFYFDELTGQRFYPNTTKIYRNDRGDEVFRAVNRLGYLDDDPAPAKSGYRIAFFGDSFTESRQVPLVHTFHELIEDSLTQAGIAVETIAIGMMGYSTLQSYLEYERWADSLAVDLAVYVFCENDPGDLLREVKASDAIPYPVFSDNGFSVDTSFRERYAHKARWPHRFMQFCKSKSLLASTLHSRLQLLRAHGIQVQVDEDARQMSADVAVGEMPEPITLPSAWPDSLLAKAEVFGANMLTVWRDAAAADGRGFVILYVPRESDVGVTEGRDSWGEWLATTADSLGIELIDPMTDLVRRRDSGEEIYYDHWSIGGHRAARDAFVRWYQSVERGD